MDLFQVALALFPPHFYPPPPPLLEHPSPVAQSTTMNSLAAAVAQRNDRLSTQAAPLAYAFGDGSLGYDTASAVESIDEGKMSVTFCVSSSAMDWDGDVIPPELIDVEKRWRANPVWLWDHQASEPPVGIGERPDGSLAWRVSGNKAYSVCHFHQHTQRACEAFKLYAARVMRACSIRFDAIDGQKVRTGLTGLDDKKIGWEFGRTTLLEISVTPIGINPEALACEFGRGGYGEAITKSLSVYVPPRRLYVAGWSGGVKQRGKGMNGKPDDEDDPYRTAAMDSPDDTPDGYDPEPVPDDVEATDADPADDVPDDEKPGSKALQALGQFAAGGVEAATAMLAQNEHPPVVKAIKRFIADMQDATESLATLQSKEYGGADDDTPPDDGGEEKGMTTDDVPEEDDETKKKKALAAWQGRVKHLASWLAKDEGGTNGAAAVSGDAAMKKRVADLESELKAVHTEWGRIKSLVYRRTGLPAAKAATQGG